MSGLLERPTFTVDFAHVEAPLLLCSANGDVVAATPTSRELLYRLSILLEVPGRLPTELWATLDRTSLGTSVQWRPPGTSHIVLGCTRYRARDGFLLTMKELSDVHAAQSRRFHRQRLESTGRLVASIAHELRNPVASIVYSADLLAMYGPNVPPETLAEVMGEMIAATTRVQATVAGLLDYARLGPSISVPVALDEVLTRAQGFLRSVYREGSHQMRVELAPDARIVRGNTLSIEQIFVNLLLNAAEAATKAVTVRIKASLASPPDESSDSPQLVRITVHDDGVGIPPSLRESVFEPFFTTREEGTGLGLNNAREAAESLGGGLTLAESSSGACFVVWLPVGRPES